MQQCELHHVSLLACWGMKLAAHTSRMRKEALSSESWEQFRYKLCFTSFSTSVTGNTSLNDVSIVMVSSVWEEKANRSQHSVLSLFDNMCIKHTEIQRKSKASLRKLTSDLLPHRTPKVHQVGLLIYTPWRFIAYILYIHIWLPSSQKCGSPCMVGEMSLWESSAQSVLRYSGKHPLKQRREAPHPTPNSLACVQGLDPVTASPDILRKITSRHSRSIQKSIT